MDERLKIAAMILAAQKLNLYDPLLPRYERDHCKDALRLADELIKLNNETKSNPPKEWYE
jgi:hypothetical protein